MKQYSDQQASAIIVVACRYRDALRRYLIEQVAAIDSGTSLDDLVTDNWQSFEEAAQAEEELFALLDTLDDP